MSDAPCVPEHGGQLRALAREFGLDPASILDFSANINPDGPPAGVVAALRHALDDPSSLALYPDLALAELRASIAAFHKIDPDAVIVANGFVPLLEAVVRTLSPTRCLLPVPAFSEYRRTLERCRVDVVPHRLQAHGFVVTPDALQQAAQQCSADFILLANPQNPTGVLTPATVVREMLDSSAARLLLLDEAFIDYAPDESLAAEAALSGNLIVFRSVTKFFAMPGLRVAYAIARPDRAAAIRREIAAWPVSTLAEIAVQAALADTAYQQMTRQRNQRRRVDLAGALTDIGVASLSAAANFLLLRLPCAAESVRRRLLQDHNLHLRTCINFEGLEGEYLRIAVRNEQDNARLVQAIADVLASP